MTDVTFAQQRPEHKLRRHNSIIGRNCGLAVSLNKGRSTNSGDTCPCPRSARRGPRPLNKGRSTNSGDTRRPPVLSRKGIGNAQQRPEHKLRRHNDAAATLGRLVHAQQRPEHKLRRHLRGVAYSYVKLRAQQRPEHKLRRHATIISRCSRRFSRSTKAGAQTPATLDRATPRRWSICNAQQRPEHKLRRHVRQLAAAA